MMPWFPLMPYAGFLGLIVLAFTIWMAVDCLTRDLEDFSKPLSPNRQYDRLIWLLIVLLAFPPIGGLVYLMVVYLPHRRRGRLRL